MSGTVALISFADADFSSCASVEKILQNRQVASRVAEEEGNYYTINVSKAMSDLAVVGDLLQVAYAGSKGFRCSEGIITILASYQTTVKNSFVATSRFRDASLLALQKHRIAFKFLNKGNYSKALEKITECAEAATQMVQITTVLISEAEALTKLATDSLTAAVADSNMTITQRENVLNEIRLASSSRASLAAQKESLAADIADVKAREANAIAKEDAQAKREFLKDILVIAVSAGNPLGGGAGGGSSGGSQAEVQKSASAIAAEERAQLQKEARETNAKLAEQVENLKHLNVRDNKLEVSLRMLELTITNLGKIKTTFDNTRLFWMGQKVFLALPCLAYAIHNGHEDVW
jgi:hypothetical protein